MPSQHIIDLCTSSDTVTKSLSAGNSNVEVNKIASKLFRKPGRGVIAGIGSIFKNVPCKEKSGAGEKEKERLDKVAKCGKFPFRPSDLFLKIFSDVLDTLNKDPMVGVVSPPLLGSSGVIPLSIVSVIPDIIRHYADLIVRAETEIFLATNYWEPSRSAGLVSEALKELSRRTGEKDKNKKIIVKLMYDRGTLGQVIHNHVPVKVEDWAAVHLPEPEEMPNVDLEVINYHRPIVGTFHAKFLIIDRKIACLNSNNIQDRPNIEMMVHLEGPIVESFYDMALISWSNALKPPLPLLDRPPQYNEKTQYGFGQQSENLKYINLEENAEASYKLLQKQQEAERQDRATKNAMISEHPHMKIPDRTKPSDTQYQNAQQSEQSGITHNAIHNTNGHSNGNKHSVPSGILLKSETSSHSKSHSSQSFSISAIAQHLDAGAQVTKPTIQDEDIEKETTGEFNPYIMHEVHKPCPIAMVNRVPKGTPGHEDPNKVPQDTAFLGAFKYAQKSIFIQTPTFNATPIVDACVAACMHGVVVTLYLDLGFNDLGEMLPFQGGTNEEVISKMYKELNARGKGENLKVFWYTAKDQSKPMNAAEKKRNCHVKFLAVDDQIAILGNGNQDTQSWFHSQEINIMVESTSLVSEWLKSINANQNTLLYGKVDTKDGIWRDKDGNELKSSGVGSGGALGRLKGISGVVRRVRGTGGL